MIDRTPRHHPAPDMPLIEALEAELASGVGPRSEAFDLGLKKAIAMARQHSTMPSSLLEAMVQVGHFVSILIAHGHMVPSEVARAAECLRDYLCQRNAGAPYCTSEPERKISESHVLTAAQDVPSVGLAKIIKDAFEEGFCCADTEYSMHEMWEHSACRKDKPNDIEGSQS